MKRPLNTYNHSHRAREKKLGIPVTKMYQNSAFVQELFALMTFVMPGSVMDLDLRARVRAKKRYIAAALGECWEGMQQRRAKHFRQLMVRRGITDSLDDDIDEDPTGHLSVREGKAAAISEQPSGSVQPSQRAETDDGAYFRGARKMPKAMARKIQKKKEEDDAAVEGEWHEEVQDSRVAETLD